MGSKQSITGTPYKWFFSWSFWAIKLNSSSKIDDFRGRPSLWPFLSNLRFFITKGSNIIAETNDDFSHGHFEL